MEGDEDEVIHVAAMVSMVVILNVYSLAISTC